MVKKKNMWNHVEIPNLVEDVQHICKQCLKPPARSIQICWQEASWSHIALENRMTTQRYEPLHFKRSKWIQMNPNDQMAVYQCISILFHWKYPKLIPVSEHLEAMLPSALRHKTLPREVPRSQMNQYLDSTWWSGAHVKLIVFQKTCFTAGALIVLRITTVKSLMKSVGASNPFFQQLSCVILPYQYLVCILWPRPSDIGQRFQITAGRALALVRRDGTEACGAHCSFGAWEHPVAGHPKGPTAAEINEADPQESFECLAYVCKN